MTTPCPLCGSPAEVISRPLPHGTRYDVRCTDSRRRRCMLRDGYGLHMETAAEAVAEWNELFDHMMSQTTELL